MEYRNLDIIKRISCIMNSNSVVMDYSLVEKMIEDSSIKFYCSGLLNQIKAKLLEKYFYIDNIKDKAIQVSGNGPYQEEDIVSIIDSLGGIVNDPEKYWDVTELFILGEEDYDENLIKEASEYENVFFITQNDLFNMILFNHGIEYLEDDLIIKIHPGMQYLRTIGYEWPISQDEKMDVEKKEEYNLNPEHIIKSKYGYNVKKGTTISKRITSLENAVSDLGLYPVYSHLLYLIKRTEKRKDDLLLDALKRYYQDFSWLKSHFYDGYRYTFKWVEDF